MVKGIEVRRRRAFAILRAAGAAALLGLAGCGANNYQARSTEQTVAQVDNDVVTMHQLNYRLRNVGGEPAGVERQAQIHATAQQLVDRLLLVRRARAIKLDRDPAVMLALEETRRDILATAYLETIAAAATTPTTADLLAHYNANPGRHAKRKLFQVRQVHAGNSVTRADLEAFGREHGDATAETLVQWLQQRGARSRVTLQNWPADQLPPALAEQLDTLSKGGAIVIAAPAGCSVNFLVDVLESPQSFEQARRTIASTLLDQRRQALKEAEMARLRAAATITWHGEFENQQPVPPVTTDPAGESPTNHKVDANSLTERTDGWR